MVILPKTPRGVVLTREQDLLGTPTLASGASAQITSGPTQLAQVLINWSGGAVHWQLYDGFDTTGDLAWDMGFTSTSFSGNQWVWEIPFEFQKGIFLKNLGAASMTPSFFGRLTAGKSTGSVGGHELPRSVGAKMRAYMGVAAGSGVLAMSGEGVLARLNMRTTPGNANSIVRSYDGLDKTGLFLDSNENLTNSGNSFDNWVANGLRVKNGLFLSNEGSSPVDFLLVGTIQ